MPMDVLKASWILAVFLFAFFWFPSRLFSARPNGALVRRIPGNWVRMALCVTIAVFLLTRLRTLSAITVIGLLGAGLAAAWLRKHGVPGLRPLHTLRKEFGSQICDRHGIYAASRALRHADVSITSMHYLDKRSRATTGLGGLLAS